MSEREILLLLLLLEVACFETLITLIMIIWKKVVPRLTTGWDKESKYEYEEIEITVVLNLEEVDFFQSKPI